MSINWISKGDSALRMFERTNSFEVGGRRPPYSRGDIGRNELFRDVVGGKNVGLKQFGSRSEEALSIVGSR